MIFLGGEWLVSPEALKNEHERKEVGMSDIPSYTNLEIRRVRPWVAKPRGKIRVYDGDTF